MWRLEEDRDLVSLDKNLVPLCELLRDKATRDGLGFVLVESLMTPKTVPAVLQLKSEHKPGVDASSMYVLSG